MSTGLLRLSVIAKWRRVRMRCIRDLVLLPNEKMKGTESLLLGSTLHFGTMHNESVFVPGRFTFDTQSQEVFWNVQRNAMHAQGEEQRMFRCMSN